VYAHMKLVPKLDDACKTALIAAIIADFPPGDELCAALAEAADAQAPGAAPNAAAGGGAGQAGQGGAGYSRQSRQSRHSRRRGRGKGHSSRGSRRH
jgi:hypothetical protein